MDIETVECPDCEGTGKRPEHKECDDCLHHEECPRCNGSGEIDQVRHDG